MMNLVYWVVWACTKTVWTVVCWPLNKLGDLVDAYITRQMEWEKRTKRQYWLHEIGRKKDGPSRG